MYPIYKSFRIALFGIVLNANLAGYNTAAVPNRFVSHSLVSSGQVSSVSKTLASGSLSLGKRLIASASKTSSVLSSGQSLAPNQSLTSPNGQYSLVCQSDGNLVLYDNSTDLAYWASQTAGKSVSQCLMQSDGNLVVYGNSGAVWNSGTFGHSGAYLSVQNDRNVVIYAANGQALWATSTSVTEEQVNTQSQLVGTWSGEDTNKNKTILWIYENNTYAYRVTTTTSTGSFSSTLKFLTVNGTYSITGNTIRFDLVDSSTSEAVTSAVGSTTPGTTGTFNDQGMYMIDSFSVTNNGKTLLLQQTGGNTTATFPTLQKQ